MRYKIAHLFAFFVVIETAKAIIAEQERVQGKPIVFPSDPPFNNLKLLARILIKKNNLYLEIFENRYLADMV